MQRVRYSYIALICRIWDIQYATHKIVEPTFDCWLLSEENMNFLLLRYSLYQLQIFIFTYFTSNKVIINCVCLQKARESKDSSNKRRRILLTGERQEKDWAKWCGWWIAALYDEWTSGLARDQLISSLSDLPCSAASTTYSFLMNIRDATLFPHRQRSSVLWCPLCLVSPQARHHYSTVCL